MSVFEEAEKLVKSKLDFVFPYVNHINNFFEAVAHLKLNWKSTLLFRNATCFYAMEASGLLLQR